MSIFSRIIQRSFDLLQQQNVDLAEAAPETLQIVEAPPQISDLTIATVPTAPVPPDLESTEFTIPDTSLNLSIRGQYRKERRVRGTFVPSIVNGVIQLGSLSAGGEPLQPATQVVAGPQIKFQVTDISKATYRWRGDFGFDNAEYEFIIKASDRFRVLVDGETIIDDYVRGPTRVRTHRTGITAGNHLVTVILGAGGLTTLDFDFKRVFKISWISCVDGEEREGLPPDNWIKTRSGCFKPPLTDDAGVADLLQVIDISPDKNARIERAYIKGSGTALSSHRMKFLNRSTNMTINVRLNGPKPVRFVTAPTLVGDVGVSGLPANSFELATRETKEVDVVFITSELNSLPEGLIRSDVLVSVSPGTITISKDSDDNIDIGTPIDDGEIIILPPDDEDLPPSRPPPTPTWRDCSGTTEVKRDGFPPSDWTIRSDGCYVPPVIVPPTVSFVITSVEFPAKFDGSTAIASANLNPAISAGRSAWTWQWNFDVNRQGAGTGPTTGQDPVVSWRMNERDLRNLFDGGRTSRLVEAIATRRGGSAAGQIVRQTHIVILDDARLRFVRDFELDEDFEFGGGSGIGDFDEGDFE